MSSELVLAMELRHGANFVKDFLASIKDFTGGRSGAYEEELSKARNIAFDEMNQKAREMGGPENLASLNGF